MTHSEKKIVKANKLIPIKFLVSLSLKNIKEIHSNNSFHVIFLYASIGSDHTVCLFRKKKSLWF